MKITPRFISLAAGLAALSWATASHATLILADHFDDQPEGWTGAESTDLLLGEVAGNWEGSSGAPEIAAAHAHGADGKGLRFTLHPGCSSCPTQGSNLFAYDTGIYPTLFVGYWFRLSNTDWGAYDGNLKLLRFYIGDSSCIPGMDLSPPRLNVFWAGEGRLSSLYAISDTDWHSYLWEFQRGTAGDGDTDAFDGDGVLRLWVDGVLIHESIDVDWIDQGDGLQFGGDTGASAINLQGNLSGNYAGPENQTHWDDFVVATTRAEAADFLGVAAGGGGVGGGATGGAGAAAAGGSSPGGSSAQGGGTPAPPADGTAEEDDGCGCRVTGGLGEPSSHPLWLLALASTLGFARRRRRAL